MHTMSPEYAAFLAAKAPRAQPTGVKPRKMPAHMFDFQAHVTRFAIQQGRAALFLGTGLGKTVCELEFATQAARATKSPALILTPLAVARQIEAEGRRFGYQARVIREQSDAAAGINICNYDRLDKLRPEAFGAVVLDESSVLKNLTGSTSRALIAMFQDTPFRLCATATPAPNDHMELGTHAEFLGVMSNVEMLTRWFINDTSTASQSWRLKRHGVAAFWDWVASWAMMGDGPEDLGFDGTRFVLPPLHIHRHRAVGDVRPAPGSLFVEDLSATNIHALKRQTAEARADVVASLVGDTGEPWVVWCDTDYESDALMARLPRAIEVRGSQAPDRKEQNLEAFANGAEPVIVTKPGIAGMGLNWQHCANMAYVGRSFSYLQWFQSLRRCWRFGQTRPVHVHLIVAEGEDQIGRVIDRKAADHVSMKREMALAMQRQASSAALVKVPYEPTHLGRLPTWLTSAV